MRGANMAKLSRTQIEMIAEEIIDQYKSVITPDRHLCYSVDPTELAALLGFRVDYQYLTKDGSILGKTASGRMWITVYDSDFSEMQQLLASCWLQVECYKRCISAEMSQVWKRVAN